MPQLQLTPPRGILFDYGGTLVEEAGFDVRAGVDLLLAHATHRPRSLGVDDVLARVERVTREVSARRDTFQIEAPWPAVTRLIYDYFGLVFDQRRREGDRGSAPRSVGGPSPTYGKTGIWQSCHRGPGRWGSSSSTARQGRH